MQQPAWWLLYLGLGLYAVAAIVQTTGPHPKTVWFWSSEMAGRECKDMGNEAAKYGATRWACPTNKRH